MRTPVKILGVYRIIDANINRVKEGLRVCEEVVRFILNDKGLTAGFKKTRHAIDAAVRDLVRQNRLLDGRQSLSDIGLKVKSKEEFKRADYRDVFSANIQRVKEAMRVLEEFSKLDDVDRALALRDIRFAIYELEKKASRKLSALRHHR